MFLETHIGIFLTEPFPYSALQTAVLTLLSGDTSLSSKHTEEAAVKKLTAQK